nr:hypothetical protein [Tanacetum cinerariifolium]
ATEHPGAGAGGPVFSQAAQRAAGGPAHAGANGVGIDGPAYLFFGLPPDCAL